MLSCWPIRKKLWLGVAILVVIVLSLFGGALSGVNSYRHLVRDVSQRAAELPLTAELTRNVDELRFAFSRANLARDFDSGEPTFVALREEFRVHLLAVKESLRRYRGQLEASETGDTGIGDVSRERDAVREIETALDRVDALNADEFWVLNQVQVSQLADELARLHRLTGRLPSHLQMRMQQLKSSVRSKYRTLIVLTWTTSLLSLSGLAVLLLCFRAWVFRPLQIVIDGSRRVAAGDYRHRIRLDSHDEMAELAAAMNDMTGRFYAVYTDLEAKVQQRTREVIRNEQLASVGFLAAGVAHEINNPLASIAWCAEGLESRLHDVMQADDAKPDGEHNREITVVRKYLKQIQDEAFRCKGITERLLDYSRAGNPQKTPTDLVELVTGVIDMVRPLAPYRGKTIDFRATEPVVAAVNPQEMKQVMLNLLTNALESLGPDGRVTIDVRRAGGQAELVFADTGCGMTPEVIAHLFEPFFTRRRDGQGTGLGLTITYRIVCEHGGTIEPHSDGPDRGSRFRITLPLGADEQRRAA